MMQEQQEYQLQTRQMIPPILQMKNGQNKHQLTHPLYPKNHVYETESGHIKEFDDTEGAERIHEYHKSGTFYEVDASGNKHTRIVGTNYEVIAGSDFVNVKGTANLTIRLKL